MNSNKIHIPSKLIKTPEREALMTIFKKIGSRSLTNRYRSSRNKWKNYKNSKLRWLKLKDSNRHQQKDKLVRTQYRVINSKYKIKVKY